MVLNIDILNKTFSYHLQNNLIRQGARGIELRNAKLEPSNVFF